MSQFEAVVERGSKDRARNFNNKIAVFAKRKQLSDAISIFNKLKEENLANSHSYAAILNAYIRCGDIAGAASIFDTLLKTTKAVAAATGVTWIKIDVILFTTMIRGYCSIGSMSDAMNLFTLMNSRQVTPNIRTINTLLRGAVQAGAVDNACEIYKIGIEKEVVFDSSTYEMYITLLAQALLLDKLIYPMLGRLDKSESAPAKAGLPKMYYCIARACLMVGDWKRMKKFVADALSELKLQSEQAIINKDVTKPSSSFSSSSSSLIVDGSMNKSTSKKHKFFSEDGETNEPLREDLSAPTDRFDFHRNATMNEDLYDHDNNEEEGDDDDEENDVEGIPSKSQSVSNTASNTFSRAVIGGKRAWREEEDENRQASLEYYLVHRREELTRDCEDLLAFHTNTVTQWKNMSKNEYCRRILQYALRVLLFPPVCSGQSHDQLLDHFVTSLRSSYGVDILLKNASLTPAVDTNSTEGVKNKGNNTKSSNVIQTSSKSLLHPHLALWKSKLLTPDNFINLSEMFTLTQSSAATSGATAEVNTSKDNAHTKTPDNTARKPVRMEICSGAGDWVVEQAVSDVHSHWVAVELRHDRVYNIFTKSILKQADNLVFMRGDAMEIMPLIASESVDTICVNFPEPPQQTANAAVETSEAAHLLQMVNIHIYMCVSLLKLHSSILRMI